MLCSASYENLRLPNKGQIENQHKKIMEATQNLVELTEKTIQASSTFEGLRYQKQVNFLHQILREESARIEAMHRQWDIVDAIGMERSN